MFIKNSSASAGATNKPPVWRPQALTTAHRHTTPAAVKLTQNAISRGNTNIEAGIIIMAASSASFQLFQAGVYQGVVVIVSVIST